MSEAEISLQATTVLCFSCGFFGFILGYISNSDRGGE